ncbi:MULTISPECIES: putative mucin/carbohydrate-binding domain-containing protein [Bacillus cereus group]|uniref:putative mucin/carbohydrate-binding domain-containing protein n=1 Tax=Bacillus cereus group TaxID=86661 RepID=UPI00111C986A|nr:putative mucin/carbohydrate-binding domain-containing protein [Bacillus thuringiensis]MCU5646419.1 M60 family metallopeptidase [Bacillus cereus]MEB9626077.1 putative mucin/carbohydrate-binding domain-containing protein [Bacillus cereus]NCA65713.1 S-layer protein [Bacillus cereus]HDR5352346.1 S-layer protein [Bacillus thuringiensis]
MGNKSKHKTKRILVATATLTIIASGMASSSDIFAEETQQQRNLSTSLQSEKSVKSENRTFTVPGKGDVEVLKQQERKSMAFSPYEPTGLYAKPNEQITINVEGNQDIQVYIGTYSYDASWREDSKIKSFTLKPGINTIQSPNGGLIYFYNKQQGGSIRTTITTGGTTTPFFELGKHTKQDLINMLDQYPNAHAVELKGERVLITASPARVKKYLLGSNTDPVQLLKKMDEATRIQDKVAGLSEEQVDKHYVHYVEENHSPDYYMYATSYRTAYVGDAIQYVLDINKFIKDGWGPWHEAGHLRQQSPWKFYNMTEVQNNIYSLSVEKAFTSNQPFRLQQEGAYTKAFQYLEQPNKNYDEVSDVFVKLVMLWQLQLAYGEDFYPKLHQLYRDMPSSELPQTDENKKQLFMISASKVAKQNLIPFFEKWGLRPNNDTIQKVAALGYPILTAEIWKGTDSNPIKPDMPNVNNILEGNQFAWSLKGIGDFEFAKVNLNKSTEEMQIDLKAGVPHNYFDSTYASIKVQNTSGKVVYNKEIYGNKQQNAESQKVSVKVGDYIELTHLEGVHRATLTNVDNSKQESFGKKAIYEVTKEGLKKVEKMPEATILDGNQFAWSLKGISDFEFAKINFNKSTEEMQVSLKSGIPHHYFNETYASIKVQNASGKVVYNKDIYGNKQQNAESQKVSVKVGDYIELTHLEGVHRATLTNVDNSKQESFGKKAMYKVTKEGLKKVEKMPETTVLDGNQFAWSLKGYSDREIAKVEYNKLTEKMQIKIETGIPHSYFTSTYASIKVQNSSGNILYNKEIVGNRQQAAESQTVPVKVGDYIEFTHIEGEAQKEKTRATLTNLENSKQEFVGKKKTYQVTPTGLLIK